MNRVFCCDPTAYTIKKGLVDGSSMMEPVGMDRHSRTQMFLNEEDETESTLSEEYFGFWRYSSVATLSFQTQWRGLLPVWNFVLQGKFSDLVCDEKKQETFDQVQDILIRSASTKRDDVRVSVFSPRGLPLRWNGGCYDIKIEGEWDSFSGAESIVIDNKVVWSATFMGQLLHGRSW